MKIHDVIVVGAGPAGSALAIQLAQAGYSVLLLEKSEFPRDKVCGDFVSPKGLRHLDDLGCFDEIAQQGFTPIFESEVYLNGRKLSQGRLPHLPGHPPFGYAIPRHELDETVFRRAQEVGAQTVEACRVVDFHTTSQLGCVEADVAGRRQRFAARVIVGADGANSVVARIAGLQMNDPRYVLASVRGYCHGLPMERTLLYFHEDFFPGFGWIFPVKGDVCNVGVGMVKEPLAKHRLRLHDFYRQFEGFVKSLAEEAGRQVEITPTAGWPIKTYGGARRNYFGRGLLIGEAGCFVDPISGEGIPLALESAELGFQTLTLAFERGDFSAEMLADYEHRWRQRWDPDLKVSDLIVSMVRNRYMTKLWLTSFKIMGMTALRDEDYALKTGGILAGLVPNREGFSPDVILKSLIHGPGFWLEALDVSPSDPLPGLARGGLGLARWQAEVAVNVMNDFGWFRDWALEVDSKQRQLFQILATAPPPGAPFSVAVS